MQQLSLSLGIVPQIPLNSTNDPYWDEITQQDDSVGGQPLNPGVQIENTVQLGDKVSGQCSTPGDDCPSKSVGGQNENSCLERLSAIEEKCEAPGDAPGDDCPPTIQVGDFVGIGILLGRVLSIEGTQATVEIENPLGSFETLAEINDLELFKKQVSPCKAVSGQVNNTTAHQHKFTDKTVSGQVNNTTNDAAHQHNGWVEKYSVPRNGHKYYYWRFAWREGAKKHRKYLGSCTSPQVKERVNQVKSAIALGKLPHEIMGLI